MVPGPSSVDSYRPWTFMYRYIMGPGPSSVFFYNYGPRTLLCRSTMVVYLSIYYELNVM